MPYHLWSVEVDSCTPPEAVAPTSCRDVTWTSARERAHAAPTPLPATRVPLAGAAGFTLAGALRSPQPMPGFDTAAMDGYAVGPGVGPWRVRGVVRAGGVWTGGALYGGEAVGISTGAPVPAGAHAVIPLELATRSGDLVHGPSAAEGRHIRRAGEDAPAGSVPAPAGTRIGPALLGPAAACGNDTLPVRPRPRVRVLVTGDELTRAGRPATGRVRDARGPLLPPLIEASGGETVDVRHVPDRPVGSLRACVGAGAYEGVDVTVVTGSTSVGVTDQLRLLLAEADAHWVVDPGHPLSWPGCPGTGWWACPETRTAPWSPRTPCWRRCCPDSSAVCCPPCPVSRSPATSGPSPAAPAWYRWPGTAPPRAPSAVTAPPSCTGRRRPTPSPPWRRTGGPGSPRP